ncbi:hypothetical protein LIER_30693 [Lithospermum erythrorhizon]|uniref:Uncharacterized protein n=1 Tax=Lithospermum erythrorhizon TaxID=34254 RepID=A0AAV3RTU2_LITER
MCVCVIQSVKNRYPKEFAYYTVHGKGSYPIYRRKNDGCSATVRGKSLDSPWVVPYNPTLLLEFNFHFNIKIFCDIRVVKYLYKYVHKEDNRVAFRITQDTGSETVNDRKL